MTTATAAAHLSPAARNTVLRVAWLSVLLGLGLEIVLLAVAAASSKVPSGGMIVADTVQKVSWSVFVCVGLVLGVAAASQRSALLPGVAGMLAAPLAFVVARALHKGVVQALALAPNAGGGPSPLTLALLKGLEYGTLGLLLGGVVQRSRRGFAAYALAGFVTGLVFGGIALVLMQPLPPAVFAARAVNEILFPVGCALVAGAARAFGSSTPQELS